MPPAVSRVETPTFPRNTMVTSPCRRKAGPVVMPVAVVSLGSRVTEYAMIFTTLYLSPFETVSLWS